MLSVATVNLFTFAFGALFILYVDRQHSACRRVRSGLALGIGAVGGLIGAVIATRIGRRIGLGPAYALGCVVYPLSLLTIPLAGRRTCPMPLILGLILRLGVRGGARGHDPRHQRRLDQQRPDRPTCFGHGPTARTGSSTTASGRSARSLGGVLGTAIGVREAIFVTTIAGIARGPVLDDRLAGAAAADLPDAARRGRGVRTYSQRKVRTVSPTVTTAQTARTASDRSRSTSPEPSATRNASARAAGGQPRRDGRQRIRQVRDRQDDPTEEQEGDEQAVRQRERRLRPECARHEQAETGERRGPEQQAHDEGRDRCPGPGAPAEDGRRDHDQQHDLRDLDHEDRPHLGRQQPAAGQRRPAEPLEDAVVPLVRRGDAEVDEARGDDGQGERAGQEEVDRVAGPPVGTIPAVAKKSRTTTGMTIVTSTFSPRRAVRRSSIDA